MADPILSGMIRVQAILQGVSGLPEDRYVTTWAFSSDAASTDAGKSAAIAKVRNFYTATTAWGGKVSNYIGGATVNESLSSLRAYDLGDPPDLRVPLVEPFTGLSLLASASLPSEVAACVSYYAGLNRPGLRGRVYIGPLNVASMSDTLNQPVRLNGDFIQNLAAAADAMVTTVTFPRWSIISRGFPSGAPIGRVLTNGWVDNAFDTQRRRGEDSTARQVFSAAVAGTG